MGAWVDFLCFREEEEERVPTGARRKDGGEEGMEGSRRKGCETILHETRASEHPSRKELFGAASESSHFYRSETISNKAGYVLPA